MEHARDILNASRVWQALMALCDDTNEQTVGVISIPRDTLVARGAGAGRRRSTVCFTGSGPSSGTGCPGCMTG